MTTIAEKLILLNNTKKAIAAAIEAKGITVADTAFSNYPSKIKDIYFGNNVPTPTLTPWVRPTDWPALPTLVEGNQRFVGLHAVYNDDSNFLALSAAGNYTVDWGDGVIENYTSGAIAYHTYSFSNVNLSAVTSRGYKCAIVSITMQSGQLFTALNLHCKHSQTNLNMYSSGFLDIAVAGPSLSSLLIGAQTAGTGTQAIRFANLEQVQLIGTNAITNMGYMFNSCYSLQSVPLFDTSNVTNMSSMFYYCYSLQSVPLLNTSKVTNMSNMFINCSALQSVPLFDTSNVTNMSNMFINCSALQSVPLFDTSKITTMSGMFNSCYSLQSVPLLNTSNVTTMSSMFNNCSALQSVPLFDTSNVTNMSSMFYYCYSLQSVPLLNTSKVTTMSNMFNSCNSLSNIDMYNIKVSLSVASCKLSASALNKLYSNLATATGQTITVTSNFGTTGDNPAIATAKGWTVSGS